MMSLPREAIPISWRNRPADSTGYAYAGPFRPRPAYRFIVENSVYVAPWAKGRGVGTMLLQGLVERGSGAGLQTDGRGDRRRIA